MAQFQIPFVIIVVELFSYLFDGSIAMVLHGEGSEHGAGNMDGNFFNLFSKTKFKKHPR